MIIVLAIVNICITRQQSRIVCEPNSKISYSFEELAPTSDTDKEITLVVIGWDMCYYYNCVFSNNLLIKIL